MSFQTKSLQQKLDSKTGVKRILALDGGGVRGILTLGFLEKIESTLRTRYGKSDMVLSDYYDMMGGTSTGAIMATGLALGMEVKQIIQLYLDLGEVIFGKRSFSLIPRDWTGFRAIFKENYNSENLEKQLKNTFGEILLGDTQAIKCGLAINTKRADTYSLWTFANHPDGIYYNSNKDIKLWELCRASSAAPYYFKPKQLPIKTRSGKMVKSGFVDGGVSLANNPVFQLFLTATVSSFGFNWVSGENKLFMTSLGTGNGLLLEDPESLVNSRAVAWASKLPNLFMIDALEMNQIILQYLGKNYGPVDFIDNQFGKLEELKYLNEKLFSFTRHNVRLTAESLAQLGFQFSLDKVRSVAEMDHYENIPDLLAIGRKAAEQFTETHLPTSFDL